MAYTVQETIEIYNTVLQRDPTQAEIAAFVAGSQETNGEQVQLDLLVNSAEAQDDVWPFIRVYESIFNRVPDAAGLNFWVDAMRSGLTLQTLITGDESLGIAGFANSAEFIATYGENVDTNSEAFITALYQNLLGRAPDAEGLAFFTGLPEGTPVGDVVAAFTESPEFGNTVDPLIVAFLTGVANGTEDYEGSLDDLDPGVTTFTLTADDAVLTTAAAENVSGDGFLSGSNDVINALGFDGAIIQDGSTTDNDVLNMIGDGSNDPSLVENIETVNIRSNAASTLNLAAFSGLVALNASGAATLGVTNLNQDEVTVGLSGETDVTVTTATAIAADDVINVNVDGATGSLTINDGTAGGNAAVALNSDGAASQVTLAVGANVAAIDELVVTGAAAVEITADTSVTFGGMDIDATAAEGEVALVTAETTAVDAADFDGVDRIAFTAATAGATNLEAGTIVELQTAVAVGAAFTVEGASAAGSNDDALTIRLNAGADTDFGAVTVNSVETITVDSTTSEDDATVDVDNVLSLTADAVEEVVVTGDTDLTLSALVDVVSAGEFTGDLTITLNGANAVLATTGSGNDQITVSGDADVITTGAGSDIVIFADGSSTATATVEITDFVAGDLTDLEEVDTLEFGAAATYEGIEAARQTAITADTSLADAAAEAAGQLTANEATAFSWNGSTYVLFEDGTNAGAYNAAEDVIVELS